MEINTDKIICLKLSSGEEIITKVTQDAEDQDSLILDNPRSLVLAGNGGLQLAPVLFSANPDQCIVLNKKSIICYCDSLREELENGYRNSVSKIITPNKNIILG